MQSGLYVALSAQVALQKRLETIAQNVANGSSAGYRGSEVKFNAVLSKMGDPGVSFVSSGSELIRRASGQIVKTGNPLDIAVKGDGWLSISTPNGSAFTRDGRMRMDTAGNLVSTTGAQYLDAGGAPIQLDPTAGQPAIGEDGTITQAGNRVGVLGLYRIAGNAQLSRVEGGAFTSSIPGTAIVDSAADGVMQGYVEQSNVNPMSEMTRLIYVQRAFEGVSSTIQSVESSLKGAIQTLGS